jgi:hypothetical protein
MATTYHIQNMPGLKPQAFVARLEVKSIFRGRSRVLGGIPGANRDYSSPISSKFTTTDTNSQPAAPKQLGYLRYKH